MFQDVKSYICLVGLDLFYIPIQVLLLEPQSFVFKFLLELNCRPNLQYRVFSVIVAVHHRAGKRLFTVRSSGTTCYRVASYLEHGFVTSNKHETIYTATQCNNIVTMATVTGE